jgi:hypothetical protein
MSCQSFGSRLRGPDRLEPELEQRRKHRGCLRTHLAAVPCSVERLARRADQIATIASGTRSLPRQAGEPIRRRMRVIAAGGRACRLRQEASKDLSRLNRLLGGRFRPPSSFRAFRITFLETSAKSSVRPDQRL